MDHDSWHTREAGMKQKGSIRLNLGGENGKKHITDSTT